jgi:transcriptional regulator of acetoin/glycerol metabolism
MVEEETFRSDLLTRLWGFTLELPALRDRREDLGMLIATLLPRVAPRAAPQVTFRAKAVRCLFRHEWPGNVRELEKCLGTAVVLARDGVIGVEHLPPNLTQTLEGGPTDGSQQEQLVALLTEHAGNISAVARALGKAPMQIRRWMKRFGIDPQQFRR